MMTPNVLETQQAHEQCGESHARDPIYLFACQLEWHQRGNLRAYSELMAALDDCVEEVRLVAEALLTRGSRRRMAADAADDYSK